MISKIQSYLTPALRNRRQKKAAIQSRRSQKSSRLNFDHLERRNLLATFVVNSAVDDGSGAVDGLVSLREAIVAANTNAAFGDAQAGDATGDTILFDGPVSELTHTLLNGELEITDDLVITGSQGSITIDAANASRIFNINTNELVALNNLTLTNGTADRGGAILSEAGGTTRLTNVTLTNNTATADEATSGGGGIFTAVGSLFATGLVATGNVANGASGSGGAIFQASGRVGLFDAVLESNVANRAGGGIEVIDGSFFASNITLGTVDGGNIAGPTGTAAPGNGGGFHSSGVATASFVGGTVQGNFAAAEGGGLWNAGGSSLFVSDVDISDNIAAGDAADNGGGGVFNNGGTVSILGSFVNNNAAIGAAGSGGGILSVDGQFSVFNSEVNENVANRAGGGIEIIDGRLIVRQSELNSNIAGPEGSASPGNGGGLHVTGNAASAFIQVTDVLDNFAALEGGGLWNQAGSFLRVDGGTLIAGNTASGDGADDGGGGIFNNGGRVTVLNSTIEDNLADGVLGSGGGVLSVDGSVFVSGSTVSGNDANRAGGGFEIIDGRLDVAGSTIDGNSAGSSNPANASPGNGGAFHVTGNASTATFRNSLISNNSAASEGGGLWNQAGSTLVVAESTIRDNIAEGDSADNGGGGVFNNGGIVRVADSFINGNSATGVSGSGGGLFSTSGQVFVNDTSINDNSANRAGGGIEVIDGFTRLENAIVNRNLAGGDAANPGNGGGVHVSGAESLFAIIDSTFIGNVATNEGGALWNQTGSLMTIRGATRINVNVSEGDGGGIYNRGRLLAQDALFTANTAELDGGGIFTTETGQSFLTRLTVRNNEAGSLGGGLANFGELAVVDSVFENNFANNGGAIAAIEGVTGQGRNTFSGNTPNNVFRA